MRIRPDERIPVDGEVVEGHSSLNEALITGEPLPVEKHVGSTVAGGAINGSGTLLLRVTAIGEDSFLQRVIKSVEDARALKPGLLHIGDRVLRVYTPTVREVGWPLTWASPQSARHAKAVPFVVKVDGVEAGLSASSAENVARTALRQL